MFTKTSRPSDVIKVYVLKSKVLVTQTQINNLRLTCAENTDMLKVRVKCELEKISFYSMTKAKLSGRWSL